MQKDQAKRHCSDVLNNNDLENEEKSYVEPKEWTIITALDRVLSKANDSGLSDDFWSSVKNPIAYLRERLELTDIQIVLVAIMAEAGEPMSWRKFGSDLDCSRLSIMCYSEEIEGLLTKRWVIRRGAHEMGGYS